MAEFKIEPLKMMRLLGEGKSQADVAREFGCTSAAIGQMTKRLEDKAAEVNPFIAKSELSGGTLDAMDQIRKMNDVILGELDRCRKFIDKEDRVITDLDKLEKLTVLHPRDTKLAKELAKKSGLTYGDILKLQNNVIAVAGEVRKQIELQLKIAEALYSVAMVAEFQEEVIQVLKDADVKYGSEISVEVIKRLKDRRAMRGLLKARR